MRTRGDASIVLQNKDPWAMGDEWAPRSEASAHAWLSTVIALSMDGSHITNQQSSGWSSGNYRHQRMHVVQSGEV
jgi:hypothetical protein